MTMQLQDALDYFKILYRCVPDDAIITVEIEGEVHLSGAR